MTPEKLERARRIVETVIHEQIGDIDFHRILVKPDLEKYDDSDCREISVIYEGEREQLAPRSL